MTCRHGHLLRALVLGLLAPIGCMRWQSCMPQTIVAQHPVTPSAPAGDLTPAQAAQLCLTAGEALEKKGFTAEALHQYENARKCSPQAPGVARHLAVVYDLQGDASLAEREYLRALQEQSRDAELLNDFGYFNYRHNHLPEAESWLRKAVAADPSCACGWTNLGQVLASQGRAEESYQAFTHVLRPAEAYSNVGILLAKHGHTAEARKALQQAVKLDPKLLPPRAFLNALGDMPGPLPPGLMHTPQPVLRMSAAKPTSAAPPPASKLADTARKSLPTWGVGNVGELRKPAPLAPAPGSPLLQAPAQPAPPTSSLPPRKEWTPLSRGSAAIGPAVPLAGSSPPPTPPPDLPDLPIIVNGPIQPTPIFCRPAPVQSPEPFSCAKPSLAPPHKTPSLPPPSPPPLALLAANSTEGPSLVRASVSTLKPDEPHASPPKSLPPMPLPASLASKSLPPSARTTAPPKAILTDCQSENEPEHGSP